MGGATGGIESGHGSVVMDGQPRPFCAPTMLEVVTDS